MNRFLRTAVTCLTAGAIGVGSAWADADSEGFEPKQMMEAVLELTEGRLDAGWWRAGAATGDLTPDPDTWVQGSDCTGAPEQLYTPMTPEGCLITFDMRWADGFDAENPNQVRSFAISNGEQVVVLSSLDLVGYMAAYPAGTCDRCGLDEIARELSTEMGIPAENFSWSSSHTHAAASTIADGPAWYYDQVAEQIRTTAREAILDAAANPAVRLESGSVRARALNTDRRIVDRAVPDDELNWLRAYAPSADGGPGNTIATLGNFAVHLTVTTSNAELHSGAVGPFNQRLEDRLGGTGLWAPGALGDQKTDRGWGVNGLGISMADLIVDAVELGYASELQSNDIEVRRQHVQIPVENQFFAGALAAGYAIRSTDAPYGGGPLTVENTNHGANMPSCTQAGALHVVGAVTALRLGARPAGGKVEVGENDRRPVPTDNVTIIQAPGELFASIGLVVKDYMSRSNDVLVLAMTNDTLGYMIPSNQYDTTGSQGLGIANNMTDLGNYEEALSLGSCTGDLVMSAMIEAGAAVGVIGEGERP